MKKTLFRMALAAVLLAALPAQAGMKYLQDPVYKSLDPEEESPMQEMLDLANGGDIRAQYILGDLYTKGKGGLAKDERKGVYWFETAAKNGYAESFVRLAAIAKRNDKAIEAYKWYTLAAGALSGPRRRHALAARDELVKEAELKPADTDQAKKAANIWKADLRREKDEQRRKEAAEKKKEKEKKDAPEKQEKKKS